MYDLLAADQPACILQCFVFHVVRLVYVLNQYYLQYSSRVTVRVREIGCAVGLILCLGSTDPGLPSVVPSTDLVDKSRDDLVQDGETLLGDVQLAGLFG